MLRVACFPREAGALAEKPVGEPAWLPRSSGWARYSQRAARAFVE